VASYFWNEVQLSMQQGKAAVIMDATNFGPRLEDPEQSNIAGKVGYALMPRVLGADGAPRGPEVSDGRFGHPRSRTG
jgi:ABC-type glycerol-3-phosphate transport system substrate-binding protein